MAIHYIKMKGTASNFIMEILGDDTPANEAANMAAKGITPALGFEYTSKNNGEKYKFTDNGGGSWRKNQTGAP